MERAQNGDQAAFAAIYRARAGEVSRYAGVILRNIDLVEDVTAQTFLLAWKNLPTLRRRDRFDAWLFRIAHNLAINELKRRPTASLDELPELPDSTRFASPPACWNAKRRLAPSAAPFSAFRRSTAWCSPFASSKTSRTPKSAAASARARTRSAPYSTER